MFSLINRALTKGSTIFHIDLHYFIKGSFWLTSIQGVTVLTGFLLSLIYANFLPKDVFGQYSFVMAFVSFFGSLAFPGMETAVTRATAQGRDGILKTAIRSTKPWATIAALPFLILAGYYLLKESPQYTMTISFTLCFVFSIPFWTYRFYTSYLTGKGKFKKLFLLSFIANSVSLLSIGLLVYFSKSPYLLIFGSLGVNGIIYYIFNQNIIRNQNRNDTDTSDIQFAKGLSDIRIFTNLILFSDKIIIGKLLGFEAVAVYTFAQLFPEQIKGLLKNIYVLSLPKLSQIDLKNKEKVYYRKLVQFSLIVLVITVVYIVLAPIFFKICFPQYSESVYLSQLLSLSILSVPLLLISALYESRTSTKALRIQTYPSYLLQITLMIYLTINYGLVGSVIAIIIGRLFALLISIIILKKYNIFTSDKENNLTLST